MVTPGSPAAWAVTWPLGTRVARRACDTRGAARRGPGRVARRPGRAGRPWGRAGCPWGHRDGEHGQPDPSAGLEAHGDGVDPRSEEGELGLGRVARVARVDAPASEVPGEARGVRGRLREGEADLLVGGGPGEVGHQRDGRRRSTGARAGGGVAPVEAACATAVKAACVGSVEAACAIAAGSLQQLRHSRPQRSSNGLVGRASANYRRRPRAKLPRGLRAVGWLRSRCQAARSGRGGHCPRLEVDEDGRRGQRGDDRVLEAVGHRVGPLEAGPGDELEVEVDLVVASGVAGAQVVIADHLVAEERADNGVELGQLARPGAPRRQGGEPRRAGSAPRSS